MTKPLKGKRFSKKRSAARKNAGILLLQGESFKPSSWETSVQRTKFFSAYGLSSKPAKYSSRHELAEPEEQDLVLDGFFKAVSQG